MRKVLLTTTALVALGGVSAASALDISGFQRFEYSSWDDTASSEGGGANDTQITDYNRVVFSHSITGDSGLSASGYYRINNWAEAYQDLTLSDDWGSLSVGNYTTAGGWMYNSHLYNGTFRSGTGQTFSGVNTSAAAALADGSSSAFGVTYTMPNIGGLSGMFSYADAGTSSDADITEAFLAYAGTAGDMGFRVHGGIAQSDDSTGIANDKQENSEYGINVDSGAVGVRMTRAENTTKNASTGANSAKIETNEYAITYKASDDLTLGLILMDSKDKLDTTNNPKLDQTVIAANYFIMPGLRVQASTVDFDYEGATNNNGSSMNIALRIDF
jgi:hypothetical protein